MLLLPLGLLLICEWHTHRLAVVELYQLWQVKDTRVKPRETSMCVLGYVACLCAGLCAHIQESDRVGVLLCDEIS